eukprot:g24882.t1
MVCGLVVEVRSLGAVGRVWPLWVEVEAGGVVRVDEVVILATLETLRMLPGRTGDSPVGDVLSFRHLRLWHDSIKTTCHPSWDCKPRETCTEVEVRVGSSTGSNSKTVTASTSVTCPATVSKANWLGGYTWPDTFAVTTSGSQVSVRRTDSNSGWDMDLRFKCCQQGGTPPPGPGSSAEVRRLLDFLRSIPDGQIITGQHNKEDPNPSLWGGELGFNPWDVENRAKVMDQAITEWSHKSLVALTWHACPLHLSKCYYNDIWDNNFLSESQWAELTTEGTTRNNQWKARLDEIVPHLQRLKNAGVTGRAGRSGIRKLWIFTHNYLTVQKGLTNLAWVWNLQDIWSDNLPAHVQSYYPGDAYVDVVSVDFWDSQQPKSDWYQAMVDLARPGNKPLVLGEVGQIPTVASLQSQPKWKYFMLWSEFLYSWNTPESVRAAHSTTEQLMEARENTKTATSEPQAESLSSPGLQQQLDSSSNGDSNGDVHSPIVQVAQSPVS